MEFNNDLDFARQLDQEDPLKAIRNKFIIPQHGRADAIYLLGNSLGLQPHSVNGYLQRILADWAMHGVESFFQAKEPWMDYHDQLVKPLATIVGAKPSEIVVMNQLSVNLHLMMVSFYRPDAKRYKIICEAKAFPSDQYVFETQVRSHGLDPDTTIIEVAPRTGEDTIRTEDILAAIEEHGKETALVLFSGINYYSGQVFDMEAIAKAAIKAGARVGVDLAHAAGNIELKLHEWGFDFACWCSYKYLNSGPGAIGGVFVHEKNHQDDLIRYAGWWGYHKPTRFNMEKGFKPMPGAQGWQLSTPSLLLYASHRASLEIFEEAGWQSILAKRKKLNDYCWSRLNWIREERRNNDEAFRILTPANRDERGSQVSMLMLKNGRQVYDELMRQGIMVDWREPDVIRFAAVPLYNTFEEVWRVTEALRNLL